MISLILIILLGIVVGIFTGLLPALPVFTGTVLLYYFGNHLPLEYLMTFWLVVISGSQFFGSISTITTKIPGEESSTVYLKDIGSLSFKQRSGLLYDTALGSFIAGALALAGVYLTLLWSNTNILFFSSLNFQIVCYSIALLSFTFLNKNFIITSLLILMGILLGPKNNYALPSLWFDFEKWFQGYTFYMVILGTMIIPQLLTDEFKPENNLFKAVNNKTFSIFQGIKSSIIGLLTGLIPGPSAFLASLAAYKTAGKDLCKKIIAAETANNAAVITCILPLLLMGLPINQNTLIFSNIMDIRSINIIEEIFKPSLISYFSIIQLVLLSTFISMIIYFWLSTHLINWYTSLINNLHGKMKYLLLIFIVLLAAADISSSEITALNYTVLLSIFSGIGLLLKRFSINPLPLLFSMILGDKIIWVYLQYYKIHFGG